MQTRQGHRGEVPVIAPPTDSGGAAKELAPKGPVGTVFVPLPVPIASTLPPPTPIEPLAFTARAIQEELIGASQERRRELTDTGQVVNRVVYDAMVFAPGSVDRVPGNALLFESRFESGNLRRAVHVNGNDYDLLLNWDHGTRGHTQWYYFSVSNAHAGEKYTFNIVNFCKPQSLCAAVLHPKHPPAPPPHCPPVPCTRRVHLVASGCLSAGAAGTRMACAPSSIPPPPPLSSATAGRALAPMSSITRMA